MMNFIVIIIFNVIIFFVKIYVFFYIKIFTCIKTMNILVTGGLGFIGHNFIKYIFNNFEFNLLINIDKISYCSNNKYK